MKQNLNLVTDPRFAWRTRRFSGYDIPPQEVAELYKLYTQTGGPSWINHTNWFANKQCSTWFGLTVAGGRVTKIELQNNNLAGVTSFNPRPFSALYVLYFLGASPGSLVATWYVTDIPASMVFLNVTYQPVKVYGKYSDRNANFINFSVSFSTSEVTDIVLSELPSAQVWLQLRDTDCSVTGGESPMTAVGIKALDFADISTSTQASKDSIINRLYADRALFTATHTLNISGGPALTGVYQTSAAPSTPAEKAYALVNDQNAEGFLKWVITL